MPRRIPDFPDSFHSWNFLSSIGSGITFLSFAVFLHIDPHWIKERVKSSISIFYLDIMHLVAASAIINITISFSLGCWWLSSSFQISLLFHSLGTQPVFLEFLQVWPHPHKLSIISFWILLSLGHLSFYNPKILSSDLILLVSCLLACLLYSSIKVLRLLCPNLTDASSRFILNLMS